MIKDDDIEKALDYLRDNADDAAKATAERVYLEGFSKVLKSQIMQERGHLPLAAQERDAMADPRYREHLDGLKVAHEAEKKHLFMREAAQAKIEAWRTQQSNYRAMKL